MPAQPHKGLWPGNAARPLTAGLRGALPPALVLTDLTFVLRSTEAAGLTSALVWKEAAVRYEPRKPLQSCFRKEARLIYPKRVELKLP